jgi:uncharacterized protein (TIGR02271 family)
MMSHDARDTNNDGKVSFMEKLKDKLHHHKEKDTDYTHDTSSTGHSSTHSSSALPAHSTHSSSLHSSSIGSAGAMPIVGAMPIAGAVPVGGAMPMAVPVAAMPVAGAMPLAMPQAGTGAMHHSTTNRLHNSQDLNGDGRVSMAERLETRTGLHNSQDLNGDGHVSMAERLETRTAVGAQHDETRLKLHEEQLAVSKREALAGEVDIHKRVHQERVQETVPVRHEEIIIERHALSGLAEPGARIAAQDEVVRVPLYREELVTEKRIVPTEEVIIRKKEIIENETVGATLRSEFVETRQIESGAFDARDTNRDGHVSVD